MLVKSLTPGFYAREDTKTPVKIAVLTAVLNVALAALLMMPLRHVGIALAASLANWVNALLLAVVLHRRGFLRFDARLRRRVPRTLLAHRRRWRRRCSRLGRVGSSPGWSARSSSEPARWRLLIAVGLAQSSALLAHLLGAAAARRADGAAAARTAARRLTRRWSQR